MWVKGLRDPLHYYCNSFTSQKYFRIKPLNETLHFPGEQSKVDPVWPLY